MNMRRMAILALAAMLAGGWATAGENPGGQGRGPGGRRRGGGRMGDGPAAQEFRLRAQQGLIARLLDNPKAAELAGLSAEQINTLKLTVDPLRAKLEELRKQREEAALDQAKLMSETQVNERAVMDVIEKLGQIDTEIAKLTAKQIIAIKGLLGPDQIEKIRQTMRDQMGGMRGDRGGRQGGQGGDGGDKAGQDKPKGDAGGGPWKEWQKGEQAGGQGDI